MKRIITCGAIGAVLLACIGCGGGDIGRVEGKVTLDGAALPHARVEFQPVDGRYSVGTTDENGHYELTYTRDTMGAEVGEHTVSITTQRSGDPDQGIEASDEKIPVQFNTQSELKRTVEPGSNVFDFKLTSEGEIDNTTDED